MLVQGAMSASLGTPASDLAFRLPDPPLSDGVVALRPWLPEDVPLVARACADPEIARWIPSIPQPYTPAHAEEYVALTQKLWADGLGAPFAIVDAQTGDLLGSIGVGPRSRTVGEVGYWVRAEARRRQVATRALVLVSRWALRSTAMTRLQLRTDAANRASQRVAERGGFLREGLLRANGVARDGSPRDEVMFSLLPADLDSVGS